MKISEPVVKNNPTLFEIFAFDVMPKILAAICLFLLVWIIAFLYPARNEAAATCAETNGEYVKTWNGYKCISGVKNDHS